jgi:iron complex transport system substrate-binding protein
MAARPPELIALLTAACVLAASPRGGTSVAHAHAPQARAATAPARIVSLVPALTEVLFAIGAGPAVVGVSSFDDFPPEVRTLPRVGALLDPDTERILALRPTLVLVYVSQTDAIARFERAGIRTFSYRHGGIAALLDTIRAIGRATNRSADAERLALGLSADIDRIRAIVKGRMRPRTLLVMGRQPTTLRNMYASGGIGFMHEVLDAAGGVNVFADVARESVQPSHEMLLTRAPEVILEVRAAGPSDPRTLADQLRPWSSLPSIPAVRANRIRALVGDYLVVPGPRLARAVDAFARVLHPDAFR